MEIIVNELQLRQFATQLAAKISHSCFVLLSGPLGAGKTIFAQALLAALRVKSVVKSPSFVIMEQYHGILTTDVDIRVNHFDFYRLLNTQTDIRPQIMNFMDYFNGSVNVVEWPAVPLHFYQKYNSDIHEINISIKNSTMRIITYTHHD